MFFSYLWRELRRRARQAIFIAVGLALGIGLVITVTAASAGVKNAQSTVLHSLYGVGTDITVTKAPAAGAGGNGFGFSFRQSAGTRTRPAAGSKINDNTLTSDFTLASLSTTNVTTISKLDNVAAAAGGLTLLDRTVSGTVPAFNTGGSNGPPSGGSTSGSGGGGFPTAGTGGANPFRGGFANAARTADTVAVHLNAPVTITAVALAVALAVLGGLIAGGFGGWRAARLRPAAALSKVA